MKINRIAPGILLLILLFGVCLEISGFRKPAAVIIILLLPLTIIYFYGILLGNYKSQINSKVKWAVWILAYLSLACVTGGYISRIFHIPYADLIGIISIVCAVALSILLLYDFLTLPKSRNQSDVTGFCLLVIPIIFIFYQYFRFPAADVSHEKMEVFLDRSINENQKLDFFLNNYQHDTLYKKSHKLIVQIHHLKNLLIESSGGRNENDSLKGAADKTVTEIVMVGPEGSEKGKAYELFNAIKSEFPELVSKEEIPLQTADFINTHFSNKSVLEAVYELNYLEKLILLHTLEKKTKSSLE